MRKQYLTFLLTVLMSMVCTTVSAHDFEVDGIYYNILTPITVSVTYRGSSYDAYEEYSGSVAIPAEVTNGNNTYQVVAVGDEAFMSCKSLTAVTFPRCLKSIGTNAFNLCQGLTSVTLPTTLESIGNAAFWNCSKLKTVTALMRTPPTSLYMAFYVTSSAKLYVRIGTRDAYVADDYWSQFGEIIEMNIPSRAIIFEELLTEDLCVMAWDTDNDGYLSAPEAAAVTDLGTVFYEQPITSFKELSFFIGLTSITSRAFYNCGNLSSVNIPNKVTSIGDYAFLGCTMLKSITIPNGVTSIEQSAFYDCRSLTSVTLPNSVTSIGNEAFADCTSLTSISIPNSVTSIGEFAFYKCI